jgi:hypothetical protein
MLDEEDVRVSMEEVEDSTAGILELELEGEEIETELLALTSVNEGAGMLDVSLDRVDTGVPEAESEIDAVVETMLIVGVVVTTTLDEELESRELEEGEVGELKSTSDDRDESVELLNEIEAAVVSATDEDDDCISEEDDNIDQLLSVLDVATKLDEEDGLSDIDADGVPEDEVWSTLLLNATEEELVLWISDEAAELSKNEAVTTLDDTTDEMEGRSDVCVGAGEADGQLPSKSLYMHTEDVESKETVWHVPETAAIVSQILEQSPSCCTPALTSLEVQARDIDEDDADELMSIDEEDSPDGDGVAKGLKEGDSEADGDSEDEYVDAVEDTRLSEETLATDKVTMSELVDDGVAGPLEDETMLGELELSADELPVELTVGEMSELIVD